GRAVACPPPISNTSRTPPARHNGALRSRKTRWWCPADLALAAKGGCAGGAPRAPSCGVGRSAVGPKDGTERRRNRWRRRPNRGSWRPLLNREGAFDLRARQASSGRDGEAPLWQYFRGPAIDKGKAAHCGARKEDRGAPADPALAVPRRRRRGLRGAPRWRYRRCAGGWGRAPRRWPPGGGTPGGRSPPAPAKSRTHG